MTHPIDLALPESLLRDAQSFLDLHPDTDLDGLICLALAHYLRQADKASVEIPIEMLEVLLASADTSTRVWASDYCLSLQHS